MIAGFKKSLLELLMIEQNIASVKDAKKIVEELLPKDNFFTYKMSKYFGNLEKAREGREVARLIKSAEDRGNRIISNEDQAYLQPVFTERSACDVTISSISSMLSLCGKQLQNAMREYTEHSHGLVSLELSTLIG